MDLNVLVKWDQRFLTMFLHFIAAPLNKPRHEHRGLHSQSEQGMAVYVILYVLSFLTTRSPQEQYESSFSALY